MTAVVGGADITLGAAFATAGGAATVAAGGASTLTLLVI